MLGQQMRVLTYSRTCPQEPCRWSMLSIPCLLTTSSACKWKHARCAMQVRVTASSDGHGIEQRAGPLRMWQSALRSTSRPVAATIPSRAAKGRTATSGLPARSKPLEQASLRSEALRPPAVRQPSALNAPHQVAISSGSTSPATLTAASHEQAQTLSAASPASAEPLMEKHRILNAAASHQNARQMEPIIKTYRTRRSSKHLAGTAQAQQQQPAHPNPSEAGGQCMATGKSLSLMCLARSTPAVPASAPAGTSQQQEKPPEASAMLASQTCQCQQPPIQVSAAANEAAGQPQAQPLHGHAKLTGPEQMQPSLRTYKTRSGRPPVAASVPPNPPKAVRKRQRLGFAAGPGSSQSLLHGINSSAELAAPHTHQQPLQGGTSLPSGAAAPQPQHQFLQGGSSSSLQAAAPQAHQQPLKGGIISSSQGAAPQTHAQHLQAPGQAQTQEPAQPQPARTIQAPLGLHMQPPLKTYRTRAARTKTADPDQGAASESCPAVPPSQQPQQDGPNRSVSGLPDREVQQSSADKFPGVTVTAADSKSLSFIMSVRMLADAALCKLGMQQAPSRLQASRPVHLGRVLPSQKPALGPLQEASQQQQQQQQQEGDCNEGMRPDALRRHCTRSAMRLRAPQPNTETAPGVSTCNSQSSSGPGAVRQQQKQQQHTERSPAALADPAATSGAALASDDSDIEGTSPTEQNKPGLTACKPAGAACKPLAKPHLVSQRAEGLPPEPCTAGHQPVHIPSDHKRMPMQRSLRPRSNR